MSQKTAFISCRGTENCRHAACAFGCIGCGACENVCPAGAIIMKDGIAEVNAETCTGCGLCVWVCARKIIRLLDEPVRVACSANTSGLYAHQVCEKSCIGCGACAEVCPAGAISLEGSLAVIDYEKCLSCGVCTGVCPRGVIRDLRK